MTQKHPDFTRPVPLCLPEFDVLRVNALAELMSELASGATPDNVLYRQFVRNNNNNPSRRLMKTLGKGPSYPLAFRYYLNRHWRRRMARMQAHCDLRNQSMDSLLKLILEAKKQKNNKPRRVVMTSGQSNPSRP